jgi:Ca2+-binding EF-hand superfamily protein
MAEGNEVRKALEESGAIESSVAKRIAPKRVNELLKEVFILWDVDKSGHIELWELERLLKTLGGKFEGLIVEGFPDWLMQQVCSLSQI